MFDYLSNKNKKMKVLFFNYSAIFPAIFAKIIYI